MFRKLSLGFALLSAFTAMAAAQNFRLGVNYSELIPTPALTYAYATTASDSQGAIYILMNGFANQQLTTLSYYLIKLAPAGDQVVYQTMLANQPFAMAVDPAGNAYLAGSNFIQKLSTDGKTVVYTTTIGQNVDLTCLAVDAAGRAYVAGTAAGDAIQATPGALQQTAPAASTANNAFVIRLTPAGALDFATYLGGGSRAQPAGIAVDASGSAFVTGFVSMLGFPTTPGAYLAASGIPNFSGASFLARLSPDGSTLIYSTFTDAQGNQANAVAVDSSDEAVVLLHAVARTASVVERFNPQGADAVFSRYLPASYPSSLALDAAGNAYLGLYAAANYPTHDSLAPCDAGGSAALTVLDRNGNILQSTFIPGSIDNNPGTPLAVGMGADAAAYVVGFPSSDFAPTRQLAGSQSDALFLISYSQNPKAQIVELACVGNAASYDSTGIAGGEILSLFGQGLGPAAGAVPQVDVKAGFPKQLDGVQVTVDGIPSPLLYVADSQINAIAPWALQTGQTVQICVTYNSVAANCIARKVVAADPGVFTVDGTYAAAINQDGSFNSASNPAKVGSTVSIFATGLGAITPPEPDGVIVMPPLPTNVLPVSLSWVGPYTQFFTPLNIFSPQYAGPAPYEVAGVSQINFVVPNTFSNATYQPIYLDVQGSGPGFQLYIKQ
jgi:uncharacterized protein (TIGR03437 family)